MRESVPSAKRLPLSVVDAGASDGVIQRKGGVTEIT
jgi:hypothetical protein